MAATINTNIASINAQRNLSLSGQSLNTTMQRLSSGLRVNSAKDDAAGLAIAERMNTQVKGLTVAARNANDGISLAQTAEGALGKVGDMLQRMRELAVQASNATNSASDRKALQAEVKQLSSEIDRVAKQTNFNGQKILDGSFAGAVFQVGANSGDNVTLGALADTRASMVSNVSYSKHTVEFDTKDTPPTMAIANADQAIPADALSITVGEFTTSLEGIDPANSSLERLGQVITAINNKTADTGVTAYMTLKEGTQEYSIAFMSSKLDENNEPLAVTFNGFSTTTTGLGTPPVRTAISTAAGSTSAVLTAATPTAATGQWDPAVVPPAAGAAITKANEFDAALAAFFNDPANSQLSGSAWSALKADYDTKIAAARGGSTAADWDAASAAANALQTAINGQVTAFNGTVTTLNNALAAKTANAGYETDLAKANAYATALGGTTTHTELKTALAEITTLEKAAGLPESMNITAEHAQLNERGVDSIDVTTQEGAWIALKKIDSAVDQINGARATLGAMQTRFENAVNNIDIQVENLSAARGRIMDADFAVETANLSRTQILQQAGTAMVAQANQIPQNVLQLLQS
ncbi:MULTISPECIES: flagellin [Comamonas]|uniref:flagellin N-terminal helical domain-containing protein n=1 Tax=Comamonas TaxID=283 RepID=UPI002579F60B|nr:MULTISPECIES: flagellin [Comamonas]